MTTTPFDPKPTTLQTNVVRLEPLDLDHVEGLRVAAADPAIWSYMPSGPPLTRSAMLDWIASAQRDVDTGNAVAFAVVDRSDDTAVGSTRYLTIRRPHRGVEIGFTWLATRAQRTALNTHCKYLLLKHAFDELGAERVEFKTDARNHRSQRALERIGAVREGVFRRHMLMPDGAWRDSVYYSIVASEWSQARTNFEHRIPPADRS